MTKKTFTELLDKYLTLREIYRETIEKDNFDEIADARIFLDEATDNLNKFFER